MRLLNVLNLAAGVSCLIISMNMLLYGSIMILEPNPYIATIEVVLAAVTIALNVRELLKKRSNTERGD